MLQEIAKLKAKKQKLTSKFEQNKREYRSGIKRINKAIRKFSEGLALMQENQQSATAEIESILADGRPRHVTDITNELRRRGFTVARQSVSGILQTYNKTQKRFRRVAPATFAKLTNGEIGSISQ